MWVELRQILQDKNLVVMGQDYSHIPQLFIGGHSEMSVLKHTLMSKLLRNSL